MGIISSEGSKMAFGSILNEISAEHNQLKVHSIRVAVQSLSAGDDRHNVFATKAPEIRNRGRSQGNGEIERNEKRK